MEREKAGFLEKASYTLRNIEAGAAAIFLFLGHLGTAALMAVGAVIDHALGKNLENQRLKTA